MRVLILGCGPAGLMAQHAAILGGHEVLVLSKPRKSHMRGAQYLHKPIPLTPASSFFIHYDLIGTAEGYRRKVYGPKWHGDVSAETLTGTHPAWDIRETYDFLWDAYGSSVMPRNLEPSMIDESISWAKPDVTISTIPANLLCLEGHAFMAERIWSSDVDFSVPDNTVTCNGEPSPAWYRAANIHGWTTVEWPETTKPPVTPLWEVFKPLKTSCTCFPDVVRMGRYGKWTKGVLSHEAFYETETLLDSRQEPLW